MRNDVPYLIVGGHYEIVLYHLHTDSDKFYLTWFLNIYRKEVMSLCLLLNLITKYQFLKKMCYTFLLPNY